MSQADFTPNPHEAEQPAAPGQPPARFRRGPSGRAKKPRILEGVEAARSRNLLWASLVFSATMGIVSVAAFVFSPPTSRQGAIAASLPAVVAVFGLASAWLSYKQRPTLATYLIIVPLLIGIILQGFLTEGYGLLFGLMAFVSVSAVAALGLSARQSLFMSLVGLIVGISVVLMDLYGPPGRVAGSQQFQSLAPIPIVILVSIYIALTARLFPNYSLRAKLIISMVGIAALFTSLLTTFNNIRITASLQLSANRTLLNAAQQTAHIADYYLETLAETIQSDAAAEPVTTFWALYENNQLTPEAQQTILNGLKFLRSKSQADLYFLLDRQGKVILNTGDIASELYPRYLNWDKTDPNSFERTLLIGETYISPIIFPTLGEQTPYFYVATRVLNAEQQPAGLLAGRYSASNLQELIAQETELAGPESFAVLLDNNYLRLAHSSYPELVYRTVGMLNAEKIADYQQKQLLPNVPADQLSTDLPDFVAGLKNSRQQPFFVSTESTAIPMLHSAAITTLDNKPWYVVYMQPQSVFLSPVREQTNANVVLALVIAAGTSLAAVAIAQVISRPLIRLTAVAEHISAGDLNTQATVSTQDEIGKLATTFNTMTGRLRQTLEDLEQRVAERTTERETATENKRQRATQLQMVAEIAHTIASIQDMEKLLAIVPKQISERFGFYHVGIFLLDKDSEYAILQGANSEGGQRMLARGHRLRVGQTGLVGFVTANRQPRIALDVGRDAIYFDNPDLPLTRSEIALPLEVGDQVLGALDVQSTQPAAFNDEDVALLSTLANQVAVAIQNTRLFSETRQTLNELQIAQRQYLQQEWNRLVADRQIHGIEYQLGKIKELGPAAEANWHALQDGGISIWPAADEMETSQSAEEGQLVVPLMLRGQVIGALNLESDQDRHTWSDDEITLIRSVADQVSLALENARLIEETQRRAEREHVLSAITSKVRASTNVDNILQIAVQELAQALNVSKGSIQLHTQESDDLSVDSK